jgi:hypothetical protein
MQIDFIALTLTRNGIGINITTIDKKCAKFNSTQNLLLHTGATVRNYSSTIKASANAHLTMTFTKQNIENSGSKELVKNLLSFSITTAIKHSF